MFKLKEMSFDEFDKWKKENNVLIEKTLIEKTLDKNNVEEPLSMLKINQELAKEGSFLNVIDKTSSTETRVNILLNREEPFVISNSEDLYIYLKGKTNIKLYSINKFREKDLRKKLLNFINSVQDIKKETNIQSSKAERVKNKILDIVNIYFENTNFYSSKEVFNNTVTFTLAKKEKVKIELEALNIEDNLIIVKLFSKDEEINSVEVLKLLKISNEDINNYCNTNDFTELVKMINKTLEEQTQSVLGTKTAISYNQKEEDKPKRKTFVQNQK